MTWTTKTDRTLKVFRLGWPVSNVWLLPETPIGPVLIDTGFYTTWPGILWGLRKRGLSPRDLAAVLLTHRHVDHAGNARFLERYHIPIYVHHDDAPYLTGEKEGPILHSKAHDVAFMCALENHIPARLANVIPMTHMDVVAGLEVIHLPGHTTGTVLFYHRPSGSLFTGDALINAVPPWVIREALSLPYPDFCDNYRQTLDNLRRFATTDLVVHRMYPGHGPIRHGPFFPELTGLLNRVCPAT